MTGQFTLASWVAHLEDKAESVKDDASLVVRATAERIVASAKRKVRVDTGATRSSITAESGEGGRLKKGDTEAVIGPTTHYAPYLEFGTSRMPPYPFMGPAADEHRATFETLMEQLGADL